MEKISTTHSLITEIINTTGKSFKPQAIGLASSKQPYKSTGTLLSTEFGRA